MKCLSVDVRIYSTCAFLFVLIVMCRPAFCHVDIDVCIYSTCAFLICHVDADVI